MLILFVNVNKVFYIPAQTFNTCLGQNGFKTSYLTMNEELLRFIYCTYLTHVTSLYSICTGLFQLKKLSLCDTSGRFLVLQCITLKNLFVKLSNPNMNINPMVTASNTSLACFHDGIEEEKQS